MKVERFIYEKDRPEGFTSYLIENSGELQPGKKRPAAVICPGGGYLFLSDREAEPIATQFLSRGWQAFTVNYHLGTYDGSVSDVTRECILDVARCIYEIRKHAEEWYIDPDKIILIGFSAGGHLAASYGNNYSKEWLLGCTGLTGEDLKVAAAVLAYPVIDAEILDTLMEKRGESWDGMKTFMGQMNTAFTGNPHPYGDARYDFYKAQKNVGPDTPPTYICHAADDGLIYVQGSLEYAKALSEYQIPFELHVYETGGHGFSLANEYTANDPWHINDVTATWVPEMFEFLKKHVPY